MLSTRCRCSLYVSRETSFGAERSTKHRRHRMVHARQNSVGAGSIFSLLHATGVRGGMRVTTDIGRSNPCPFLPLPSCEEPPSRKGRGEFCRSTTYPDP